MNWLGCHQRHLDVGHLKLSTIVGDRVWTLASFLMTFECWCLALM